MKCQAHKLRLTLRYLYNMQNMIFRFRSDAFVLVNGNSK